MIQLMRLHQIDFPPTNLVPPSDPTLELDAIETEERRRTFWTAYIIDNVINLRHRSSLTLTEHSVTRLPMPEAEFQSSRPVTMGFLSEAITGSDILSPASSFWNCIIIATICGRCLSHLHQSVVEHLHGHAMQDFWNRHQWIDETLATHMQMLNLYQPQAEYTDPMLLFVKMIAKTSILYLCEIIMSVFGKSDQYDILALQYETRAQLAAQEIVGLGKIMTHFSCFKVHPLTPVPLCLCAEFFSLQTTNADVSEQLQEISSALKYLMTVNILAKQDID
jgi:hypothetical protein